MRLVGWAMPSLVKVPDVLAVDLYGHGAGGDGDV